MSCSGGRFRTFSILLRRSSTILSGLTLFVPRDPSPCRRVDLETVDTGVPTSDRNSPFGVSIPLRIAISAGPLALGRLLPCLELCSHSILADRQALQGGSRGSSHRIFRLLHPYHQIVLMPPDAYPRVEITEGAHQACRGIRSFLLSRIGAACWRVQRKHRHL